MQKIILLLVVGLIGCQPEQHPKAVEIVDASIKAHGQSALMESKMSFTFRDKQYSSERTKEGYIYKRKFANSSGTIEDILINGTDFVRLLNNDTTELSTKKINAYKNSVNSVLYFTQLPYLLNDQAVIKSYKGSQQIGDAEYNVIKVTFKSENGGEDFDDEYRYWIDKETYLVDYFAYSYHTDEAGVRFREAYNRSEKGGIIFQDYVNYEVAVGTPLSKIPSLFEAGKLKELSRIENTDISVIRLKK
ncbi:MAG: hypothetical protein JXR10_14240 [Cyclobacteriaceae bacterium]